ncbi:MAG: cellulase family glycosylhydrolase [Prevotella sp.]|nr:cellulase family glycosylhydrolase [Prevotella sp.]
MKKCLSFLFTVFLAMTVFAQTDGDQIIIQSTGGTKTVYNLTGTQNVVSSLQHSTDGKMEVYLKGLEDFGAWETYNVDSISSIIFQVQRASDVSGITLADAAASDATKNLYRYLKLNYGSKTLSSVMSDVSWNHDVADAIYGKTGKYPAINCYDFIHISVPDGNGWINYNNLTPVTEWADAGGLVSLMWHFNVPISETTTVGNDGSGVTTDPSETTFKASNALVSDTWENRWFYEQMDRVVNVMLRLQDAGIVALWRPFHEAAGNSMLKSGASWATAWFWWGADGADTYRKLWQTMFTYFQSKGVHNLVWVWTSQNYNGDSSSYDNDDSWYPGDDYVDVVARDLYGFTAAQQKTEFTELQTRYPDKLITLGECGTNTDTGTSTADVAEAWNAGAKWAWFMPWYGTTLPADSWWQSVMNESCVITRDEVNLNATMVEEAAKDAVLNMGLGFNLGNTLDACGLGTGYAPTAYETLWGQPVTTAAMMEFLKQGGFNAVRIPVTWYEHLDDAGNVDTTWMNRVQQVVDYVLSADMYCIVNVHHDTAAGSGAWVKADDSNHSSNASRFINLWTQIANRFKDYDHHLLFEGYNEMLDASNTWNAPQSTDSYAALNAYAQDFVTAVRATGGNNTVRNLIVNTYAGAHGQAVLDNFVVPTDNVDGHLAVEVHSYDPYNWINTYGSWNTTCSNELQSMFSLLNTRFVGQGIPVIIGEYGTHGDNASVNGSSSATLKQAAADQAADMVRQAKALGIATFYWMSIFDGTDRAVPQWTLSSTVSAMVSAYNE